MSCADPTTPTLAAGAPRRGPLATLSGRITVLALASAALLAIVLVAILSLGTWRTLVWQEEQVLRQRTQALFSWVDPVPLDQDNLQHEVYENVFEPREILMRVEDPLLDEPLETPGFSDSLPGFMALSATVPVDGQVQFEHSVDGALFLTLLSVRRMGEGPTERLVVVRGASNLTLDEKAFATYMTGAILSAAALGLAVALLLLALSRRLLRPLQRITTETARVAPGSINLRIETADLPTELAILAGAHNRMLDRLETAYHGLSTYADNAAHELRGPVGRIMAQAERLSDRDDLSPDAQAAAESLFESAASLRDVLNVMLFLARADQGVMTPAWQKVNLSHILADLRDLYEPACEEAGITLSLDVAPDQDWPLDPRLFQQAVSNVLENAIRHSGPGAHIDIRAEVTGAHLDLRIRDTGRGIPPEHLPFVFDRFYRADPVRNPGSGTGLGLAIVRSILRLHGGRAEITSTPGTGTQVRLLFGKG